MSHVLEPKVIMGSGSNPIGPAAGDLAGTYPAPSVAQINGAAVPIAGTLTPGNVLQVDGVASLTYGQLDLSNTNSVVNVLPVANLPSLSGNVTGNINSNTVVRINGATVPASGALTTGNGLYVTGASTLSYSALNLAGGSSYVTGVLPAANQASQSMGGDVSGTTAASTVIRLQNRSVSSSSPNNGDALIWNGSTWTPTAVIGAAFFPKLGRVLLVDDINGNDSTGAVNGLPFKTPEAAISYINSNSLTGVTIWIMPGTYNLSAGITIPNTCSIRGLQLQTVVLQMLNVTSTTTLVTMGENTRIEDLQLKLTSSSAVDLTGIRLRGTTSVTSKIRTCVITVNNSGVSTSAVTNVFGILSDGSGAADEATFSFNVIKGSTINVFSNGGGLAAGIYQPSGAGNANQLSTRDVNIYVAAPSDLSSTGTYVGVYTDNVDSQAQFRTTSISAVPYKGETTNPSVRVLSIVNVAPLSGPQTIQGVSLVAGDRILLSGQNSGIQNGIWVVQTGGWTRAADMNIGANANGAWIPVNEGTYAGESWLCVTAPAVIGTNSLVFRRSYCGDKVKVSAKARYTGGTPSGSRAAQGTYTPVTGDRIFLDNATSAVDNGLWIYNSAGAWTRALDMTTGANSLNSYVLILLGTDANKAYICTTTGTVGTTELTFVQKYLGCDIIQNAPQSGNLTNGIQLGPGTDLVTKSAGGKPFTTFVYPTTLLFALKGNIQTGTHYLWPGVLTTDDNTQAFYRFQQKTVIQGMSVNCRNTPGSAVVTVNIIKSQSGISGSGVVTPMSVTFTDGTLSAENYNTSVDFEEGTYLGVQIVSTGGFNGADIVVEIDAY